jgi:hypothetical protein
LLQNSTIHWHSYLFSPILATKPILDAFVP